MPANKTAVPSKARHSYSRSMSAAELARVPALWATFDRATGKLTGATFTWRSEAEQAALQGPIAVDALPQLIAVALDDNGVARETESAPHHNEHLCVLAGKLSKVAKPVSLYEAIAELRKAHAARLVSTQKLQASAPKLRRVK